MEIFKGTLTQLAGEGRLTLQVPQISLSTGLDTSEPERMEEIPDKWIVSLVDNLPNRNGFWFLSREGYEINKLALRVAFESALAKGWDRTNGEGWPVFERAAEEHFAKVKKRVEKKKKFFRKKMDELEEFVL